MPMANGRASVRIVIPLRPDSRREARRADSATRPGPPPPRGRFAAFDLTGQAASPMAARASRPKQASQADPSAGAAITSGAFRRIAQAPKTKAESRAATAERSRQRIRIKPAATSEALLPKGRKGAASPAARLSRPIAAAATP